MDLDTLRMNETEEWITFGAVAGGHPLTVAAGEEMGASDGGDEGSQQ